MSQNRTFKNILITGANRGLGLEFVQQYLAEAEQIFATCRQPENAHQLGKLAQHNSNLQVVPFDVTNQQHLTALLQQIPDQHLDLIINNAGIMRGRSGQVSTEDWLETFHVNSISPVLITLTLKQKLKPNSVVANITSKMGSIEDNTSGGAIIYRSSKAALNAAIKSVALDNVSQFTSVLLHPGWVQTDMGGPNGSINTQTSISGMRNVLSKLTTKDNGKFLNYDGAHIPW